MIAGWLLAATLTCWTAGLLCARRHPASWTLATVLGSLTLGLSAANVLLSGQPLDWQPGFTLGSQPLHLHLDALSAFFLALLAIVGGASTLYSSAYWTDRHHPVSAPSARAWWILMLLCMTLVLITANGIHFLIAWELFAVAGYFLITSQRSQREVRAAGWLYLGASHAGTLCLFALFTAWAAYTGTWELGPAHHHPELAPLFWLALVGFGLKAGLFPLHLWLPSAHANAPSHVSALLSGVAIKMGIYGLFRFTGWLPLPAHAGWVVAALGILSAVLGVAFALGQHDLKRLLAYHSVENIGIILLGLGFALIAREHGHPAWGQLAFAGGLLHVWNHGLFKALLFLGAGSVLHATRTRLMSRLGGLWRTMPWTTTYFFLGAAAIAGLPPLNGFVSEWLVYLALFDAVAAHTPAAWAAIPAAVLLGLTGALALACFVKVCGVVFLGSPRSQAAQHAHESGPAMRIPMLALAGACLMIGLAPTLCALPLSTATLAWQPASPHLPLPAPLAQLAAFHTALALLAALAALVLWRRVHRPGLAYTVTWDCGYAAPSPRMQYTAGSFAGIITEWFAWILRPHREAHLPQGPFPPSAHAHLHTPETVLDYLVAPAGRLVLQLSSAVRRLQHGRLQAYFFYLLLGVLAIALLATLGGSP